MSLVKPFVRNPRPATLAGRLGVTVHVSGFDYKLKQLMDRYPADGAACLEDWLVDVVNARGATVVCRRADLAGFKGPSMTELTNEELVVALCRLQALDRPQILRLAGQLISRIAPTSMPGARIWMACSGASYVNRKMSRRNIGQ